MLQFVEPVHSQSLLVDASRASQSTNLLWWMPLAWLPPYVLVITGTPRTRRRSAWAWLFSASRMRRIFTPAFHFAISASVTGGSLNE